MLKTYLKVTCKNNVSLKEQDYKVECPFNLLLNGEEEISPFLIKKFQEDITLSFLINEFTVVKSEYINI